MRDERLFVVVSQSGRTYGIGAKRVFLLDAFGRAVMSTCYMQDEASYFVSGKAPLIDLMWSVALQLQFDEARVWQSPWWVAEQRQPIREPSPVKVDVWQREQPTDWWNRDG